MERSIFLNDNGIGREVMSPTDKAASDGFPVRFSIGNQYDGGIEMEKNISNIEPFAEILLSNKIKEHQTKKGLKALYDIIKKVINENHSIDKKIIGLEKIIEHVIEKEEFEEIKHHIVSSVLEIDFNLAGIRRWLFNLSFEPVQNQIIEAINLIHADIDEAGGYYNYYKTRIDELTSKWPFSISPKVTFFNTLINDIKKLEKEREEMDKIERSIKKEKKDAKRTRISIKFKQFMKDDLNKLKKANEVSFSTIKAVENGEILNFKDELLAMALFEKWKEETFICDERYKNCVIGDNIIVQGKPKKFTTYTRKRYERDKKTIDDRLEKNLLPLKKIKAL